MEKQTNISIRNSVSKKLQKLLFQYQITPETSTGKSPAEIFHEYKAKQ